MSNSKAYSPSYDLMVPIARSVGVAQEEAHQSQVMATFDYDKFKISPLNRPISGAHVKNLMYSIQEKDLSFENPILVNKKFEIIDGQHRFKALVALNKVIRYKIVDSYEARDLILLNQNVKRWAAPDFIYYYAKTGLEDYIRLVEDVEFYRLPGITILKFALSKSKSTINDHVKAGRLSYTVEDQIAVAEYFQELAIFKGLPFYKDNRFLRAYDVLRKNSRYSFKVIQKQAYNYVSIVKKRVTWAAYLDDLVRLYNYNRPKNHRIKFTTDQYDDAWED